MNKNSALSTIFIFSMLLGQDKRPTVAILDFEGQGVDASEVQTLTERMRTEIGNTNAVRLIERKAVEKIMEEQGFQQTGCTTDECAAEVGQLLGVQFMISGSIGKMGKSYTIDAKMFSVETSETIRTKSATHKGDVSGLLTEMEILAWEIVGLDAPGSLKLKRAGKKSQRTLAVLDFEGRGITMQEAQTLTDRFTTSLSSTNKVILVERGTMNDVLQEQGFDAGECTSDECAAEVGAMLGVEYMISGSIGKIGNAYTIDAKMFSVATGAAENMKNITYAGAVEGLITEIEILAWDILSLDPPRALKRKRNQGVPDYSSVSVKRRTKGGALLRSLLIPGYGQLYSGRKISGFGFMLLEAGMIGMALKSSSDYTAFQDEYDTQLANYNAATVPTDIANYKTLVEKARADMNTSNDQLVLFSSAAIGVWVLNSVHAFLTGPVLASHDDQGSPLRLAYDPIRGQAMIQWRVDL